MNMNEDLAKKLFEQEMMKPDLGSLQESANGMHTLYEQFVKAGFTEDEAMRLITALISSFFGMKR